MAMKPTVGRLEKEYEGRVEFRALNIDKPENEEAKVKYKFIGQPQFVILNAKGDIAASLNGGQQYKTLKNAIEKVLAAG